MSHPLVYLLIDSPPELRQWLLQYAPLHRREMVAEWVKEAGKAILADEAGLRERVVWATDSDGQAMEGGRV